MPHSVLTDRLREYLRGDKELQGGDERSARGKIRERTTAGISDLALIFEEMKENDRKKLTDFYPEPTDGEPIGDAPLEYGSFQGELVRLIAFALQCADEMGMSASHVLEYAIQHYLQHRQEIDSANVQIDIRIDPVEYADNFKQDANDEDLPDYPAPVVGFFRDSLSGDSENQFQIRQGKVERRNQD